MPTLLSLVAPDGVVMTTSGDTSGDKVGIMTWWQLSQIVWDEHVPWASQECVVLLNIVQVFIKLIHAVEVRGSFRGLYVDDWTQAIPIGVPMAIDAG